MDRTLQGCDGSAADPLTYVRGLYQLIPEERLADILTRTARSSERRRRLPAESVIWLVIAMALFAADSVPKVWRRLHPYRDHAEPTDSAFSQARRRLGVAPLRHLFLETARPMATHQTVGAFYRGWRLMGMDGTVLDLPDTPENARTFGRPTTGRAPGAFPQVRLLALCELGTHAVCGLSIKPICHGEPSMVRPLLDHLGPGDLLIWDRGFFSYELIRSVVRRGAHLLARVKSNTVLRPLRRLSDGSYRAKVYPGETDRRRDTRGIVVRVIEYTHDDPNRPGMGERHRLITDLTNPQDMPAHEAPLVYHERWEQVVSQVV
jgi:Insertion element 4 transposase N-terminal/Transposase DDE domain